MSLKIKQTWWRKQNDNNVFFRKTFLEMKEILLFQIGIFLELFFSNQFLFTYFFIVDFLLWLFDMSQTSTLALAWSLAGKTGSFIDIYGTTNSWMSMKTFDKARSFVKNQPFISQFKSKLAYWQLNFIMNLSNSDVNSMFCNQKIQNLFLRHLLSNFCNI